MPDGGGLQAWAIALQAADFQWAGHPVSRAEWLGALLGLLMVLLNARINPLGWVLAIASALLYLVVFLDSRLYGQASLQIVFIVMSAWGLWQWLAPATEGAEVPRPRDAAPEVRRRCLWAGLVLWGLSGSILARATDNPAPFADAFPTAASLVGTWLLGRKYRENWAVWLLVNLSSVALFAEQQMWPTMMLYGVYALLSAWGWWVWGVKAGRGQAIG